MLIDNTKFNCFGQVYENSSGTKYTMPEYPTFIPWISAVAGQFTGLSFVNPDISHTDGDGLIVSSDGIGKYFVKFNISCSGHKTVFVSVFKNEDVQEQIAASSFISGEDVKCLSAAGIISLTTGDKVTLRFSCSSDGGELIVTQASLSMFRVFI